MLCKSSCFEVTSGMETKVSFNVNVIIMQVCLAVKALYVMLSCRFFQKLVVDKLHRS